MECWFQVQLDLCTQTTSEYIPFLSIGSAFLCAFFILDQVGRQEGNQQPQVHILTAKNPTEKGFSLKKNRTLFLNSFSKTLRNGWVCQPGPSPCAHVQSQHMSSVLITSHGLRVEGSISPKVNYSTVAKERGNRCQEGKNHRHPSQLPLQSPVISPQSPLWDETTSGFGAVVGTDSWQ